MLQAGIVKEVLAAKGMVKVIFPDADDSETQELPVLQLGTSKNRHYHLPDVGDQVYVALDENGEDGCVLGSIYSEADIPPLSDASQYAMIFEDKTSVKYDRNAHLMAIEFDDGTALSYNAESHKLNITVDSGGTIEIACEGKAKVIAQDDVFLQSVSKIALTAPEIALNTASLTCTDPESETGFCSAVFRGNVDVHSQTFAVQSQSLSLTAPVQVTGSITASGNIVDGGSNTNHHSHPEYMRV